MLRLLRFLSLRHCGRHRLRTALTFFGIVLGVAVIVAVAVVNRSLIRSFEHTIDLLAGKAVLQVTNAESGVSESLFPVIRETAGVKDAVAVVESFSPVVGLKAERLFVYGVDFLSDFTIREHEFMGAPFGLERALDFIAQPDSIALTESFARRHGFPVGSEIVLATSEGTRRYAVRALLRDQGTARAFGGNFALMDLPVAQIAFGKAGKLDGESILKLGFETMNNFDIGLGAAPVTFTATDHRVAGIVPIYENKGGKFQIVEKVDLKSKWPEKWAKEWIGW